MGNLLVASVTQQGASHAATGRPNEDSVCFELLPQGRGIVVAASDGAGYAKPRLPGLRAQARRSKCGTIAPRKRRGVTPTRRSRQQPRGSDNHAGLYL